MKQLLELQGISSHYGGVQALTDVSLYLDQEEIVVLMGPNGAGKSTLLKAMFGLVPLSAGSVMLYQTHIIPRSFEMAQNSVALVPQGRRVFPSLSVYENIEVGGFIQRDKKKLTDTIGEILELFPNLARKRTIPAGALSGGEQQMLALARALVITPKILLLDEPTLGLAPKIVTEVFEKIKLVNKTQKTAIMIVEHNIKSVLTIADRGYILDKGKIIDEMEAKKLVKTKIFEKVLLGNLN